MFKHTNACTVPRTANPRPLVSVFIITEPNLSSNLWNDYILRHNDSSKIKYVVLRKNKTKRIQTLRGVFQKLLEGLTVLLSILTFLANNQKLNLDACYLNPRLICSRFSVTEDILRIIRKRLSQISHRAIICKISQSWFNLGGDSVGLG